MDAVRAQPRGRAARVLPSRPGDDGGQIGLRRFAAVLAGYSGSSTHGRTRNQRTEECGLFNVRRHVAVAKEIRSCHHTRPLDRLSVSDSPTAHTPLHSAPHARPSKTRHTRADTPAAPTLLPMQGSIQNQSCELSVLSPRSLKCRSAHMRSPARAQALMRSSVAWTVRVRLARGDDSRAHE